MLHQLFPIGSRFHRASACFAGLGFMLCPFALSAATGTLLPGSSVYPRLVRIAHGTGTANGRILASTTDQIFESNDEGKTFSRIADVPAQTGSKFRCCETLFEMPRDVGGLRAGTLLFSATYDIGDQPAIEIYTSTDEGHHWSYHSTPVSGRGEKGSGGLWEPEFSVARDGALVMFWSDETFLCCSQKLQKIRTYDGAAWKDRSDAIASTVPADRPGMIVVRELPTDLYFMSYEICGDPKTGHHCAAYERTSRDGWNYGNASDLGQRIEAADGSYFEHAPANIWTPSPVSPNGVLLVVGQVLHQADGKVDPENGRVVFMNPLLDGSGPWQRISAPVAVPHSYDNFCPNYSSALLPVEKDASLLELASDYYAPKKCGTYFAVAPWTEVLSKPAAK